MANKIIFLFSFLFVINSYAGMYFDGDDTILLDTTVNIQNVYEFTLEAWVNPTTWAQMHILDKRNLYNTQPCQFTLNINSANGTVDFTWYNGGWIRHISNSTVPINKWTHIAVTFSSSTKTVNIFFNGKLDKASNETTTPIDNSGKLYIGSDYGTGHFWAGKIDEVRIWDVVKSTEQIKANMWRRIISEKNLRGLWHLDQCNGDRVSDYAGNDNNGAIVGATPSGGAPIEGLGYGEGEEQ